MKDDTRTLNLNQAIERITESSPVEVLASIPADKIRELPEKICVALKGNGLTLRQAEVLLDVAKSRLKEIRF